MSYTFAGTATDASSTNTSTASFNIGATPGPYVVVAIEQQNTHANPTVTIGGVSLNQDANDSNSQAVIFSGIATGLSGTQTVAITASGSAFETRDYALWYTSDSIRLSGTAGAGGSSQSYSIGVLAGNYLFTMGHAPAASGAFNYSPSTQTPTGDHYIGNLHDGAADWVIATGNAAFNIQTNSGANLIGAAATYSVTTSQLPPRAQPLLHI